MRLSPEAAMIRARSMIQEAASGHAKLTPAYQAEVRALIADLPELSKRALEDLLVKAVNGEHATKLGSETVTAHGTQTLAEAAKGFELGNVAPQHKVDAHAANVDAWMSEIEGRHTRELSAAVTEIRGQKLRGDDLVEALKRHVSHRYFSNGYQNTWLTSGHRNSWLTSGYRNSALTSDYHSTKAGVDYILKHVREALDYDLKLWGK
jgi:hypothetical protein